MREFLETPSPKYFCNPIKLRTFNTIKSIIATDFKVVKPYSYF